MNISKSGDFIENPEISVLMSVYNGEEYLSKAIESILNQSFKNFEFIIINDGSSDNSLVISEKYMHEDNRIIIIDQNNTGLTKALNIGLNHARGKYIARQDADDLSLPDRLQLEYEGIENGGYDLISSRALLNNERAVPNLLNLQSNCTNVLSTGNIFIHGTFFGKKDLFQEVLYDERYRFAQDFKFILDCIGKNKKIAIMKKPLYILNHHENNISSKKKKEQDLYVEQALQSKNKNLLMRRLLMKIENRLIKFIFKYILSRMICFLRKERFDII